MLRAPRQRRWYVILAAAICSLSARDAIAQGPAIAYAAPKACPNAAEFTARVTETLQRPLDDFEHFGSFRVTIEPAPGGYELSVRSEMDGEQGTRTLSGPDCDGLADAGALSVALSLSSAMERRGQARRSTESPAKAQASANPSAGSVTKASLADTEPRLAEPSHTSLALQLLGDHGTLPRVAPGVRLSFGGAGQRWSGRLGVLALLPATRWVDGEAGQVGGRFWLGAGRVESCLRVAGDPRGSLDGCLVFEAGALTGSGVGVDVPKRDTLLWLAPGGRVVAAMPLTTRRARGLLGLEAVVPISTQRFTVERGSTDVYEPKRVVGRVDIGVAWQFW
jgi:hypothetical protein